MGVRVGGAGGGRVTVGKTEGCEDQESGTCGSMETNALLIVWV